MPFSSLLIRTSKKWTVVRLASYVNFRVEWASFRPEMKEYNSSEECGHIINISSMYRHHMSGDRAHLAKKSLSNLSMNRIA